MLIDDRSQSREQPLLQREVVASCRQTQRRFVPGEIHPWDLPEQAAGGLEDDRVRECHDPTGRSERLLRTELEKMHTDQPEVDDFAGYLADLHTIAYPHSILPDEDKVADHRDQH